MGDERYQPRVLVALPAHVEPLTHLRGTAVVSSLQVVGEMGLRDRILGHLPRDAQRSLSELTAASWVEIDLAMLYYRAIDALGLPQGQALEIGRLSAQRVQSAFLATLLRGLRGVVTPATILSRMDRFWSRSSRGGAPQVTQVGPRSARVEAHGAPFLDLAYNRIALMGYYQQALEPTARTLYVREIGRLRPGAAAWTVDWV